MRALARGRARVVDLHGRTATPGLIDTHAHLADGGVEMLTSVDLADAKSIGDIQRMVAAKAAEAKPGEWVLGHGWDEGKLAEHRLVVAADLDAVAAHNPVWLEHTTGHYGVANTAALRIAHQDANTPDPVAGTIKRDASGAPTGVLMESAMDPLLAVLPKLQPEQRRAGILAAIDLMHREGMTGAKDPDIGPEQWDAYVSLARAGRLNAHICVLWHTDPSLDSVRANISRLADLPHPPAAFAPNLVSCGVKIYMDGSGGARTAWMYDDWNRNRTDTDTGNRGYPLIDPAVYRDAVNLYTRAGIHVATHAIGDRAIDWVVDTYAQALAAADAHGLRHAIIHANTPTDHAIEMMATLQRERDAGYPETQGGFAWWIGDNYAANLGPERSLRLNPYHTYLERGIRWGGGSDFSVTPLAARYGLWASIARQPLKGTFGAQPFGTAEAADIDSALRSYTVWAAHELFLDDEAGALAPGKSADIAVWDRDPTSVPVAAIRDMKCELTLFRGAVVYRAANSAVTVSGGRAGRRASRTGA
jgi:predicted amidohydrolase YtcJ